VLDEGRLVAEGTHEELDASCPLYRLLLAGPGDDAEGIDAGELAYYESGPGAPATPGGAVTAGGHPGIGVMPGNGQAGNGRPVNGAARPVPAQAARARPARASSARPGRGGARISGPMAANAGFLAGMPASPELLAKVEALPPANDTPRVDDGQARAADPRFTLRRLLRPFLLAFGVALVLDALDALASLAMPALVRGGIDHGVEAHVTHVIWVVSLAALLIVCADWVVNALQTQVVGRNGERLLYVLRVKIFSHLQRLGLDYYESELSGRIMTRMTTDVEALSTFLQTGLITTVNSVLIIAGVLIALLVINLPLGLTVLAIMPAVGIATVIFARKSSRAYQDAREKVSEVNADLQENVAGLRVSQAYRREQRNLERFAGRSDAYRRSRMRAQRYIALYFPFVQSMSILASALVLLVAVGQLHSGALTAGALIAYLLYIDMLFSPVQELSQVFDGYQQAAVGVSRIRDLLRTPTSTPGARTPWPGST